MHCKSIIILAHCLNNLVLKQAFVLGHGTKVSLALLLDRKQLESCYLILLPQGYFSHDRDFLLLNKYHYNLTFGYQLLSIIKGS